MDNSAKQQLHRIIVIDDNPDIFEDFKSILVKDADTTNLNELQASIFDNGDNDNNESKPDNTYELSYASQGQEGFAKIKQAHSENRPYSLAFVDMRMPPGWTGMETIEHIWEVDSDIQIVICSAYSDYSWTDIIDRLGNGSNLLILKKPFDRTEVAQIASFMTQKWFWARQISAKISQLQQLAEERDRQLKAAKK